MHTLRYENGDDDDDENVWRFDLALDKKNASIALEYDLTYIASM